MSTPKDRLLAHFRLFRKGHLLVLFSLSYLLLFGYFYLLTDRLFFSLLAGSASVFLMPWFNRELVSRKRQRILMEFQDFIYILGSQLKSGKSMDNALMETKNSLFDMYGEDAILGKALEKILSFNRFGVPYERGFELLEEQYGIDAFGEFAGVIRIARTRGGAFGEILRETNGILAERMETEREIGTLMARGKMEVRILRVVPFVLLLGLKFLYPEMVVFLTGSWVGLLTFLVAGILVGVAFFISSRLVEVEWE